MKNRVLAAALYCAASAAGVALAATPPKPDGVYPLVPGTYVAQDTACAAATLGAVRRYDGEGIASAHTRDCRAAVRERQGQRFTVDQTCLDGRLKLARRFAQRQQVTVHDAQGFTQQVEGRAARYRYCPAEQLPATLRNPVE